MGSFRQQTPTEFLINHILHSEFEKDEEWKTIFDQAKEMEKTEKAKHTLFIGKVVDEIGFERTKELLIEVKNAFGQ